MTVINAESMGTYGSAWQTGGYSGPASVAPLIGSLDGREVIVVGSADTVFEELDHAQNLYPEAAIFAVNDIGMFLPKIDHWFSLHGDKLGAWKSVRWLESHDYEDTKYHSTGKFPYINYNWEGLCPLFALSGYFAMQCAYIMGAPLIILAGCHGSPARRFFDTIRAFKGRDFGYGGGAHGSDAGIKDQVIKEMARVPEFYRKVRSTGGWTKEYFGTIP